MVSKSIVGKKGEDIVSKDLQKRGYKVLKRNYFTCYGEIDIIAEKNKILAFVEVKTRKNTKFGLASEAVTKSKQQKIIKTAFIYLQKEKIFNRKYQFDVAEVYLDEQDGLQKLNYIENAFIL